MTPFDYQHILFLKAIILVDADADITTFCSASAERTVKVKCTIIVSNNDPYLGPTVLGND